MRCYEVNTKIHAQRVIAQNQGRILRKSQAVELQSSMRRPSIATADHPSQKVALSRANRESDDEDESPRDSPAGQGKAEGGAAVLPTRPDLVRPESPTIPSELVEYIPAGDESYMRIQEPGNYRSRGTQADLGSSGFRSDDGDGADGDGTGPRTGRRTESGNRSNGWWQQDEQGHRQNESADD